VLIEDLGGPAEAITFAQRLSELLEPPYVVGRGTLHLSASIGIALSVDGGVPEELLTNADTALSRAKERGKGRNELYSQVLRARVTRRTHVEQGLRRALEEEELDVVYQPVVDVRTGSIVEAEALLRWHPREWDFVAPTEFIPVAEQSGVILPLGRWVLRKACAAAVRWTRESGGGEVRVAVNVSGQQLSRGQILTDVGDALMATGLSPRLLRLELTETVLMDDPVVAVRALQDLRRLGVALSIDDFGTGYSSLLYLRDLPVDTVKIDRLFVSGLGPREADTAIVHGVIRLAHALDLEVTAEGVETEDQLRHLAELGCDAAQGYLWSPGVPVDDFRRLLRSGTATPPAPPRCPQPDRRRQSTSREVPPALASDPALRPLA
jgi:predicted signal transduction protein with EAL and GGDEF domain